MVRSSDVFDMPTARRMVKLFRQHALNLRHVVMKNGLHVAAIPFDRYARPIRFSDGALIAVVVAAQRGLLL
jgi:hypothetical protein